MKFKPRQFKARRKPGEMNKSETLYAEHLEALNQCGDILHYAYESMTLKIAPDCRFTPDFMVVRHVDNIQRVMQPDDWRYDEIEFHEVKALWKKKGKEGKLDTYKFHCEDDALVKIKCAAETFHMFKFFIVWKGIDGNWERKEIN